MRSDGHDSLPSVEERTRELARLLATGLLCLRDRRFLHVTGGDSPPQQSAKNPPEILSELP